MNKKIGIVTFHKAVNYGAALQCFALYRAVKSAGYDCEVVDYLYDNYKRNNTFQGRLSGGFKKITEYILMYPTHSIRKKKIEKFLRQNTTLSEKLYTPQNIADSNQIYDSFIAGSDQIWDLKKTGNDINFYLSFVKDAKKKNSYAASLGELTPSVMECLRRQLLDFNHISVREKDLQEAVEFETKRTAELLIDPTFLIDKIEWMEHAVTPKENDYILVYTLAKSPDLFSFAKHLAQKTGLKIIYLSVRVERPLHTKIVSTAGIDEYLGYFSKAKYVLTNSFHGTAFSIIMEKEFFIGLHREAHMGNARMETLLDKFGLKNRLLENNLELDLNKTIDYELVRSRIKQEKESAFTFLNKIITNIE
ncbi:MAG: hypothetical protein APF81_10075 [Desulfosporosinus sp. BRH_c37]|nr:MAG: hypothetical protein APF81_10075 [Desulfosporosinus sp. BRH_c37]